MDSRPFRLIRPARRALIPIIWCILLVVLSAGCSGISRPIQTAIQDALVLHPGTTVGQTFVSNFGGMSGIRLNLEILEPGQGEIILHLRSSTADPLDLAAGRLSLAEITASGDHTFTFPPQPGSQRSSYYAFLELVGTGQVAVASGPADSYLDGSAYINNIPQEAQLSFSLVHDPLGLLGGLVVVGLQWLKLLAVAAFLFLPPGWALLLGLYPKWHSSTWIEKVCLSLGASLAVYPLLILLASIVGLRLGALVAWLPSAVGLVFIAWVSWRRRQSRPGQPAIKASPTGHRLQLADLAFIFSVVLLVVSRLWPVHNLDAPLWGDSYQHTLIASLIVDHGGLFTSWEPYAPISTFTYHFGFHSAVAAYHWITGDETYRLTLWVGQILNIMAVLALVPLAVSISRSKWAAVVAVLAAGLFSPMPMYYLNWGRYTQLAGQVVLPVFMFLLWKALSDREARRSTALLAGMLAGGLALNHYLVLVFAVLFALILLPFTLRRGWVREPVTRLIMAGGAGALLFLPRFLQVFDGSIFAVTGAQYAVSPGSSTPLVMPILWTSYLPVFLWLLLLASFAWAVLRKDRLAAAVGLLWGLLLLLANPARLGLPFNGALSNLAVLISFYIPAGILVGASTGWLIEIAGQALPVSGQRKVVGAVFLLLLLTAAGFGVRSRQSDLEIAPHALLSRPDLQAMDWIRRNTPDDSLFLVNSIVSFGSASAGTDGGWWIPYFTGRSTTQPPMNYGQEKSSIPGYHYWLIDLTTSVIDRGLDDPQTIALLKEWGVTHIYIGQQQGTVNYALPSLPVDHLLELDWAVPVYHHDRVWIFALDLEQAP